MLILASASPRRQELLRNVGIAYRVQASEIPEIPLAGETPRDCAVRLAREKALAVGQRFSNDVVLGADTIVVVDGAMLGKPANETDAARMLRLLSGRTHEVITGVCVVATTKTGKREMRTASETTVVTMAKLSEQDIASYVATGEPMDKAGGYAIQGIASRWIPRIEGDYSNVVGLPVALVWNMLQEFM